MTLEEMRQVDPATVDRDTLVDISTVKLNSSLDREEQALNYLKQIKNPYLFLCHGILVHIVFSDTPMTLEDKTEQYIRNRQAMENMKKF